jgi:hypothetical protein
MIPLKVDPKLPHHYLIGVAMHSLRSGKLAGKVFLKYGPVHFTNDDVDKVLSSIMLSSDKLFKTTEKEALKIHDCSELVASIGAMKISISANEGTMHHFSSQYEIDDEWFAALVDMANISNSNKELLDKSRVPC